MAKPSDLPEWASSPQDANDIVVPSAGRKQTGWHRNAGVPEKPPYQFFNWFMNLVYQWISYFNENINQGVKTTDAPTFNSAAIGGINIQGGYVDGVDVSAFKTDYDAKVNQGVKTTDAPTFNSASIGGVNIQGGYVDSVDVSSFKTDYDAKVNQDVRSSAYPTFARGIANQAINISSIDDIIETSASSSINLTGAETISSNVSALLGTDIFSMGVTFRLNTLPVNGSEVFRIKASSGPSYMQIYVRADGILCFRIVDNSSAQFVAVSSKTIEMNRIYSVIALRESGTNNIVIYCNGIRVYLGTSTLTILASAAAVLSSAVGSFCVIGDIYKVFKVPFAFNQQDAFDFTAGRKLNALNPLGLTPITGKTWTNDSGFTTFVTSDMNISEAASASPSYCTLRNLGNFEAGVTIRVYFNLTLLNSATVYPKMSLLDGNTSLDEFRAIQLVAGQNFIELKTAVSSSLHYLLLSIPSASDFSFTVTSISQNCGNISFNSESIDANKLLWKDSICDIQTIPLLKKYCAFSPAVLSASHSINAPAINNTVEFACIVRHDGTNWYIQQDSIHKPVNINITDLANESGGFLLSFPFTANWIHSVQVTPDETICASGVIAGVAVGLKSARFTFGGISNVAIKSHTTKTAFWFYTSSATAEVYGLIRWKADNTGFEAVLASGIDRVDYQASTGRIMIVHLWDIGANKSISIMPRYDSPDVRLGDVGTSATTVYAYDKFPRVLTSAEAIAQISTDGNFWIRGIMGV